MPPPRTPRTPARWKRHSDETLLDLVARSTSTAEVVRRLGISPVGGNQAHIGRRIAALNLDTSHVTQGRGGGGDVRRRHEHCVAAYRLDTSHFLGQRRLVLEIDHTNGDRPDNRAENLRSLCPSRHSQTRAYANRSPRTRPGKRKEASP